MQATPSQSNPWFTFLAFIAGFVVIFLTGGLSLIVIIKAAQGKIDLSRLISEPNGDASMSRLQLLIFTFVISLSLFLIVIGSAPPAFPGSIPADLLTLLGISASSYLVSKGIQFTNPAGLGAKPGLALTPSSKTYSLGAPMAPVTFTAIIAAGGNGILPAIQWSLDAPSHGTLMPSGSAVVYTPDANAPANSKVTVRAQCSGFEDGTADITYAP
jgi:hypothetical protein